MTDTIFNIEQHPVGGTDRPETRTADIAEFQSPKTPGTNFLSSEFLRPGELAKALGVSVRTLARWHAAREGPPRIQKANQILYRKTAVIEWLKKAEVSPVRSS